MSPKLSSTWKSFLALSALLGLALPAGAARPTPAASSPASPGHAAAAAPWEAAPFTADPGAVALAAAQVKTEKDDDAVVLLMEVSYSYDAAGRETYSQRLIYRLLSANAHESWSTVEESWEPWHQARPEIRARVITPDGAEHQLDPTTISESSAARDAPDMFDDGRVLRAPLPATRPGAVVEQQVTVRDTAPFFEGGVVRLHTLDPGMPVLHARVILEGPATLPLRWVVRGLPGVSPKDEVAQGRHRLTFEARDLQSADDPEPGLPSDVPRAAYVAFSTGSSWADLARRYSEIVDRTIRGADVSAFLRSAAGGPAASQLETINRILVRMSDEVRYTGMELGEGGLIPRTPAQTLKRRFGDCKDKAVLLTALLRASDIPAYVALLNAGEDDPDVEASLPGFGLFNHAIVIVPGTPALWIDPTDPYARAGELPSADQGRLALVASPTATDLVHTPEATSADNRVVETREVFLADLGPSRIVETSEYQGAIEHDVRAAYALQDGQAMRQALKDYAVSAYLAEDLAAIDHSKPADLSEPMRLRIEVKNARRGFTDERNAAVGVSAASLLSRLPDEFTDDDEEEDTPRRADYVFRRPITAEVRYRIVPPVGYVPEPLPAARVRHLGTATLAEEYAKDADNVITATFRLDTGKRRISPQEFTALRTAVREAGEEKVSLLLFDQTGEAYLDAGKVPEALTELRRLATLESKKALPRTRIARALLAGGMGEPAREEARQAVKLEPKLAAGYRHLGWILEHDELGRRFGPGFDRAGALTALRKARELDPKDQAARTELAILLEHDAEGIRYSPRADLGAAIDEYKALKKDLGTKTVDDNLLIALVRAGRFAEAKELAAKMKDSQTGSVLSLTAIAATDGVAAAVREGEHTFSDDKARAAALQSAAQALMLARRYPEAAALMERASRQSENAAALLSSAEILRKARRHEEIPLPADKPATPVRRLMLLSTSEKPEFKQMVPLFSRDLASQFAKLSDAEAQRLFEAGFAPARRQLRSQQVPVDTALDLAFGSLQEEVSGDDAEGYRVALSFSSDKSGRTFVAYVVREGSEYKIAGLSTAASMMGEEVLRRVQRGDLAGARRWLDWVREEDDEDTASTDPVPLNPFLALWSKGAPSGEKTGAEKTGAEEIRCAAATLLDAEEDAKTLQLLHTCRDAAGDPARRNALDVALVLANLGTDHAAEAAEITGRLLAASPSSEHAEGFHVQSLLALNRWDEIRALAEKRLQRSADDAEALQLLIDADLRAGDLGKAEARLRQIVKSGKAKANDYNELAWLLLERGRVDDEALDFGQRAATLSEYRGAAYLHTLASLYAEKGRTAEAYRILMQSIDARVDETASPDDWYVFGRLAEQYGLPDVARKYYQRVPPPKSPADEPMSTHALAARRLAALGGEKGEKKAQSRATL